MRPLVVRVAQPLVWAGLPVLLVQGRGVRRDTPVLPEAAGPRGVAPGGPDTEPLRLLVVGESTAAGVGVADHREGMAGRLGAELARRTGRTVRWRAAGRTGARANRVRRELVPEAAAGEPFDLVAVLVGVNDVLRLTRPAAYERQVAQIVSGLRGERPVPVVLAAVPRFAEFPSLPSPLRSILGLRAAALDLRLQGLARRLPGVAHAPAPAAAMRAPGFFAADGFHPGAVGYTAWAAHLAPYGVAALPAARQV